MSAHGRRAHGQPMSVEEFLQLPDEDPYRLELVRGQVVREPPTGALHGVVQVVLGAALHQYVSSHRLGRVMVETGYVLSRTEATVRGPDISFLARDRIQAGPWPLSLIEGAPDLAVEILSPSNRAGEVAEKVADYLAAGCRLVWVVDPIRRQVTVHEPGKQATSLLVSDALDGGPVLPGFRLPIEELFAG